ncbi:MAG: MCP four helix bundle domain-containing protein, partial [Armatimonadetes bacterium]|nr:MCP four helix bundle domain-containing protein [Armatimonadota bacterium]
SNPSMKWFYDLKIRTKLILAFVTMALIAGCIGILGIVSMRKIVADEQMLYEDITNPLGELAMMYSSFIKVREALGDVIIDLYYDPSKLQEHASLSEEKWREVEQFSKEFEHHATSDEVKQAYDEFLRTKEDFAPLYKEILQKASTGNKERTMEVMRGDAARAEAAEDAAIEKLMDLMVKKARQTADSNIARATASTRFMIILVVAAVILAIALGMGIASVIGNPIKQMEQEASKLALGDVDVSVEVNSKDEIGSLAHVISAVVDNLKTQTAAADRIAQGDVSVDVKPASDKDILGIAMNKMTNAIRNLMAETTRLAQAARDGDLDARGDVSKYEGGYKDIIQGINDTVDAITDPIKEAVDVLARMAARDMTARVTGDYKGDHARIKEAINTAVENLHDGFVQVSVAADQVASAAEQISSASQSLAQGASEQASSIEEISSSLQEMDSVAKQNASNADTARSLTEASQSGARKGMEAMQRL